MGCEWRMRGEDPAAKTLWKEMQGVPKSALNGCVAVENRMGFITGSLQMCPSLEQCIVTVMS